MSKNYKQIAQDVVAGVGGAENIKNLYHCQTRLRFTLADESKADKDGLEKLDAVKKVILNGGVYQVVIGTDVAEVFDAIQPLLPNQPAAQADTAPAQKKSAFERVIDFVAGVFQPIIPALSGAGMLKALLALLVVFKLVDSTSQTYAIFNFFADAVFYFLPILLAFTEAQKLKCNPILAAAVAGIMMHPNWGAMVAAGEPVRFFDLIPFHLVSYTGTVIPIILVVFVQAYVEKALNRIIPKSVNLVFVPMLTFLVMGTLALAVLGPIGSVVGEYLALVFNFLAENASWAPAVLIGGLLPLMVMFGLHNGVAPLGVMQMAELGYDSIFGPGCVCSNIAQGVAALVVSLRTKNTKERQVATSGGITALMGITEPVLYGVNLPKKYPLIAAMIGGACGGLYAGLTHTHRFATGSSGLPAILLYIGDDTMMYFYNIIIALVITAVVTAIVTYILSLKFEKTEEN
ncbi:PTS transporter subunit EIIC [Faecalibacterium sp. An122]|uniref:PTS transporter subunit EIIC n=1 Tax=Faecalibacterium sp. An122 TaxID=1965551 RepID=UPI000B3AD575|nr:PTS transporter subunit EIIC [Faecalibacterium sp. An122]OUQ36840.1 PTS beta-glucoside transporter subunit EIIBCA [Faecalibacterium sp. An122]